MVVRNYGAYASGFLDYLEQRGVRVADVIETHVEQYLRRAIVQFEKRHGRRPYARCHKFPRSGINALLRLVHSQWPPGIKPACVADEVRFSICAIYEFSLRGRARVGLFQRYSAYVAATNNISEREIRPSVVFRKVINGFPSDWGAQIHAGYRSVIGTARLSGKSALVAIRLLVEGTLVVA